jgi:hypothetical protein
MRAATWWQHCHDTGVRAARVAQGPARRIDEQRLRELAVGDEGAVGARDDAHGQAGAARRLRAGDREQQRVPGAVGRDTVEQQVSIAVERTTASRCAPASWASAWS